jgi:hypothetical protein
MINPTSPIQVAVINPLLKQLEDSINHLALAWRGCEDPEEAHQIELDYQNILRCMIALGFNSGLDVAAELPYELMPQEYFDLFKR